LVTTKDIISIIFQDLYFKKGFIPDEQIDALFVEIQKKLKEMGLDVLHYLEFKPDNVNAYPSSILTTLLEIRK
jgi:hypothetical protein